MQQVSAILVLGTREPMTDKQKDQPETPETPPVVPTDINEQTAQQIRDREREAAEQAQDDKDA